jgi:hypothetical protein
MSGFEIALLLLLVFILLSIWGVSWRLTGIIKMLAAVTPDLQILRRINQQLTWVLYLDKKSEEAMLFHAHNNRFPGDRTHHEVLADNYAKLWEVKPGCAGKPDMQCWADFVALRMMQQGMSEAEVTDWKNRFYQSITPLPESKLAIARAGPLTSEELPPVSRTD